MNSKSFVFFLVPLVMGLLLFVVNSAAEVSKSATMGSIKSDNSSTELPLFWGWFIKEDESFLYLDFSRNTLSEALGKVPEFLSDVKNFTNQGTTDGVLSYYTRDLPEDVLHCTSMYNGIFPNNTDGAEDYANSKVVKENVGKNFTIHAIGWILTPRTFGARLHLKDDQLPLWNQNDTEKQIFDSDINEDSIVREVISKTSSKNELSDQLNIVPQDPDILDNFKPTSGRGSRAHMTLGCAPGESAVTTGLDLVDIIEQESLDNDDSSVPTFELEFGWLRNYGNGRWALYPRDQVLLDSVFQGSPNEAGISVKFPNFFFTFYLPLALTLLGLYFSRLSSRV